MWIKKRDKNALPCIINTRSTKYIAITKGDEKYFVEAVLGNENCLYLFSGSLEECTDYFNHLQKQIDISEDVIE